jgi:hypothetical protein
VDWVASFGFGPYARNRESLGDLLVGFFRFLYDTAHPPASPSNFLLLFLSFSSSSLDGGRQTGVQLPRRRYFAAAGPHAAEGREAVDAKAKLPQ